MSDSDEIVLENWMTNLSDSLKDTPFIYIAIPGSHDSMTFAVSKNSGLAPDIPPFVRNLWPLLKGIIVRWTRTQQTSFDEQLHAGIRYFDLRFATKSGTDDLFFTHGLYAGEVTEQLDLLKHFLDSHPGEIVILDCQHFYEFQLGDHRRLFDILIHKFGLRICPVQRDLETVTIRSLHEQGQQVIIVYRDKRMESTGRFWRGEHMPSPWPRCSSAADLLHFLEDLTRAPGAAFVTQAVITPTAGFIVPRFYSNIRDTCARHVSKLIFPWISTLSPGRPPPNPSQQDALRVNVVIADFIDLNDNYFPKTVVGLNYKMGQ